MTKPIEKMTVDELRGFMVVSNHAPTITTHQVFDELVRRNKLLVDALKPFSHPDLRKLVTGNAEGINSPVFGRDGAVLRINDFEQAANAIKQYEGEL